MTHSQLLLPFFIAASVINLFAQIRGTDTVFLFKDTVYGISQSSFIDNNRNSRFYDQIINFRFGKWDQEVYARSIQEMRDKKLTFAGKPSILPWKQWVTLKQYAGRFYVYKPCDFMGHYMASVTDSTFIDWTGEGLVVAKIMQQRKINAATFEIRLANAHYSDRKIIIHLIDRKNGIAVFEETADGTASGYRLMIAAAKVRCVPIIVSNCEKHKKTDLEFEEPDFNQLLKRK